MGEYVEMLRQDEDEVHCPVQGPADRRDQLLSRTRSLAGVGETRHRAVGRQLGQPWPVVDDGRDPVANAPARDHDTIRVWVPGCATGEEPYSIAMLLTEKLQEADKAATSISSPRTSIRTRWPLPAPASIPKPSPPTSRRNGCGSSSSRANTPTASTRRFAKSVVFAEQNVISDPPFSKLDLISCRNLLIYLEPEIQQKILAMFHFALREGGYLFLGNAETISQQHDLFETMSRK